MFFSNDTRVADTATPNNFVVGSSDPNVGQYGWTKEDRGHYNQLLQYVEECRAVVDQVTEMASYIENLADKMTGITGVYNDIIRIQTLLTELEEKFQDTYTEFTQFYAAFTASYQSFTIQYQDFLTKYQEVLNLAIEARDSANAAKASEDKSKASADAAADSAREAAELVARGQIYRGTWKVTTSGPYPDHKNTNSAWDVILDPADEETGVMFDGKKWYAGDRLLYIVDTAKYEQVVSGTNVKSVNGKAGAVTIDATDVGALTHLPLLQQTMPSGFFVGQMIIGNDPGAPVSGSQGFILKGDTGLNAYEGALAWGYGDGVFSLGQKHLGNPWSWSRVYHEGFKPSAADVGAVNKSGDVMTGPLTIAKGGDSASISASTGGAVFTNAKTGSQLVIGNDDVLSYKGYKVYHEKSKPTAADVGAFPITGGFLSGPIQAKSYVIAESLSGKNWAAIGSTDDSLPWVSANVNGTEKKVIEFTGDGDTLFTRDARAKKFHTTEAGSPITTIGGKIRSDTSNVMSLDGNAYSYITSPQDAHLCQNSYWDGKDWLKYSNSQPSGYVFVREGQLKFNQSEAGISSPNQHLRSVYHTGFKPTADDIGAIPVNRTSGTPVAAYFSDAGISSVGTKISLPYAANAGKMLSFTIRVYQEYRTADIQVSGYLYSAIDNWHLPKAIMIAGSDGIRVKMGRDTDGKAYVHITGANYRGIGIFDVVSGYSKADWNSGWVITKSDDTPDVALDTIIYPPYSPNNKPTANDVGAVNKAGDSMWGNLKIKNLFGSDLDNQLIVPNAENGNGIYFGNVNQWSRIHAKEGVLQVFDGTNIRRIYHEGYKPTLASIGAVSKAGDTFTGEVVIDTNSAAPFTIRRTSQVGMQFIVGGNVRYVGVDTNGVFRYGPNLDHSTNDRIYHQGFPPTARDIEVSNPLTKDVETLSEVITSLRSELASLRAEVQILRRGTLES